VRRVKIRNLSKKKGDSVGRWVSAVVRTRGSTEARHAYLLVLWRRDDRRKMIRQKKMQPKTFKV